MKPCKYCGKESYIKYDNKFVCKAHYNELTNKTFKEAMNKTGYKIRKRRKDGVIQTYNVKPTHEKKHMKQINQTIAKSLDKQRKKIGEQIKYPDELNDYQSDKYEIIDVSKGSYTDDYKEAYKIAKKIGGEVYTIIDGEGPEVYYLKGIRYVNRIGVCVLKREK